MTTNTLDDALKSAAQSSRWLDELKMAKKEDDKWVKRGKKIVRRYRDDRTGWADNSKRYNILWANVQTIFPAIYGKTPRAAVERRHKDQDPIGRTAATILERALQYEIDQYRNFDAANRAALLDRLLPGRGTSWVRLEVDEIEDVDNETGEATAQIPYTKTCEDIVFWEDFRCSPARVWEEVTWVARRVYMSKGDVIERFGEEFADIPLTHEPIGLDDMQKSGATQSDIDSLKKAQVWEIWDKNTKNVTWVAEGFSKVLDEKKDPYGLDNFWPCPKPLYATQTTDTLVPVPDYALYQDQAEELDKLTNRIHNLVDAVKVVGVYDASQQGVQRLLNEGVNNTLIPVDTWAAFGEKGGLKGVVDFLPIDMVLTALNECYRAREQAKQVIYEVTGLSDIIRGASVASETATAQQIKSQYASLRIKRLQVEMAVFASEMLQIKAQLMADFYPAEQLIAQSGIMGTMDGQYAEQAIALLKSEPIRNFRIEVAADSLVEIDEISEKQQRLEFLQSVGTFMERTLPVVQQAPELGPLVGEMLMFGVRAFKGGRTMEAAFDDAMAKLTAPKPPAQPQPNPEEIKAQMQAQQEQQRMQQVAETERMQQVAETERERMRQVAETERERMQQVAETERERMRLEVEIRKPILAPCNSQMKYSEPEEEEVDDLTPKIDHMGEMARIHAETMGALANVAKIMGGPKRRILQRGPDGGVVGLIEVSMENEND